MLRNILLILLIFLSFVASESAKAQDPAATEIYVQKLEARIQKLERDSAAVVLGKERLGLVNERIDNLQAHTDRSTADLANLLAKHSDWVTILMSLFGLFFALLGIGVAAFINSEQKKTGENLKKTEVILEETKKIEVQVMMSSKVMDRVSDQVNQALEDVNATRELIDNNLSELYKKLQAEEVNYHIDRITKNPQLIFLLYERLTVLPLNNHHFNRIKDLIVNQDNLEGMHNMEFLYELLFLHFPQRWLQEVGLKQKLLSHHDWILGKQSYPRLVEMISNLCEYLQSHPPVEVDFQVGSVILEKGYEIARSIEANQKVRTPKEVKEKRVEPDKHLTKELYVKLQEKSLRFQMYDALRGYNCGRYFWELLQDEYADEENNTEDENYLLNVCKDVYLSEIDTEDE